MAELLNKKEETKEEDKKPEVSPEQTTTKPKLNPETQEINIPDHERLKKYEREDSSIEYWKIVDNLNKKPKSVEDAQARIGIADESINKIKEEEKTLDEKIVAEEKQIEAQNNLVNTKQVTG